MVVCPVCEHAQEFGLECEQCGRNLTHLGPSLDGPPVSIEVLDGLEPTVQPVDAPAGEALQGLEPTHWAKASAPAETLADLDVHRVAQAPPLPAERVEGFETFRADASEPTPLPVGPVACRYCGYLQAQGLMCDRCGMRLPRRPTTDDDVVEGMPLYEEPPLGARCAGCGVAALVDGRCRACGRKACPADA